MKISTKGRYALRLLVDLGENMDKGYVSLKDVANRQQISKKYLEQIVPLLNKSNILLTNRGFQGGYKLSKSPDTITVGDVLRITEGNLSPITCLESDSNTCERSGSCCTIDMWRGLQKVIEEYLDSITIQDLLNKLPNKADEYII